MDDASVSVDQFETPSVEEFIEYFKEVTIFRGKKNEDSKEEAIPRQEDENKQPQAAYSLAWFYENCQNLDPSKSEAQGGCADRRDVIGLNRLCRAYFGDAESRESLQADIKSALIELKEKEPTLDDFIGKNPPNEEQQEAIGKALALPISFIQGPPGTGKTATILNIMAQALKQEKTVAVVSSNNSAIENIVQKMSEPSSEGSLLRDMQGQFADLGCVDKRNAWKAKHPDVFEEFVEGSMAGKREVPFGGRVRGWESDLTADRFLKKYPIITSTIHSLKKCFADGANYQFDYVIMDEASQTDLLAGVVAMSAARHLVLVGDDNQLPPVFLGSQAKSMECMRENAHVHENDPRSLAKEDLSFLGSCYRLFPNKEIRTMLCEHYRCQPGIIKFCNREIYDNQLKIRTKPTHPLPISIRWFKGDYSERGYSQSLDELKAALEDGTPGESNGSKKPYRSRRNMRQLTVFFQEEWPRLQQLLREDEEKSICFLTPYRLQHDELKKRLLPEIEKLLGKERANSGLREYSIEEGDQKSETGEQVSMLTVNRSQGREFDIVYFMPVDDRLWKWPWSQKKHLVNVAVSRAKKELHVIVSSKLMSSRTRNELESMNQASARPFANRQKPVRGTGQRAKKSEGEGELFVQKLIDYVRKEGPEGSFPESNDEYGFHESALASVFDDVPQFRISLRNPAYNPPDQEEVEWSAPEACILSALYESAREKKLDVMHNVPFSEIVWEEDPLESDGSSRHFDFVVCEQGSGRVVLVVEVDGGFHRYDEDIAKLVERYDLDSYKDSVVREEIEAQEVDWTPEKGFDIQVLTARESAPFAYVRIPSDGSTYWETSELLERARETGGSVPEGFSTLDDLIDRALRLHGDSVHLSEEARSQALSDDFVATLLANKGIGPFSLTRTLEEWRESDDRELAELLKGYDSPKLHLVLERLGVIQRDEGNWGPTEFGERMGIVLREKRDRDTGETITYPVYWPQARDALKRILLACSDELRVRS